MEETQEPGPVAEPHLGPAQEGSPSALLVVRRMNDWKSPISRGELAAITGLPPATLVATLRGLQARHRIVVTGHGPHARWQLAHLAKAAQQ